MRQFVITERITAKGQRALELYKQDVNKRDILSPDEEYEYAVRAQQGDEAAINILVEANLRFVMSVAKMYTREAATMEDLIQVGNIGLVDAARRFDPSKGFKFISFAVWHIRKEMINYLAMNSRIVRLPQNKGQLVSKVKEAQGTLYTTLGREPTEDEIIEWVKDKTELGKTLDKDTLLVILSTDLKASSLDRPFDETDNSSGNLGDSLESEDKNMEEYMTGGHNKQVLEQLMVHLNPLERYVVEEYFGMNELGFERNPNSISFELESSGEAVRQRLKKALKKMKLAARRLGLNYRDIVSE